jgi:hypothetical protein
MRLAVWVARIRIPHTGGGSDGGSVKKPLANNQGTHRNEPEYQSETYVCDTYILAWSGGLYRGGPGSTITKRSQQWVGQARLAFRV